VRYGPYHTRVSFHQCHSSIADNQNNEVTGQADLGRSWREADKCPAMLVAAAPDHAGCCGMPHETRRVFITYPFIPGQPASRNRYLGSDDQKRNRRNLDEGAPDRDRHGIHRNQTQGPESVGLTQFHINNMLTSLEWIISPLHLEHPGSLAELVRGQNCRGAPHLFGYPGIRAPRKLVQELSDHTFQNWWDPTGNRWMSGGSLTGSTLLGITYFLPTALSLEEWRGARDS
jgi:hypothetical protein